MTENVLKYPTAQAHYYEDSYFPNAEKVNILVVDDLPEKLLAYEAILEELEQNLVKVRSGEEALKLVLKQEFAVILLDVNMPGMDGFETASLIRQRKKSAHTPIIFLTAFTDEMRMAQGYASGAVDYLPTPVVPEILKAKVKVFIELSRMRSQAALQAEEHAMRKAAEQSARRSEFILNASEIFTRSHEPLEILQAASQLPIPVLADISLVYSSGLDTLKPWAGCAISDQQEGWHFKGMHVELDTASPLTAIIHTVMQVGQAKYLPLIQVASLQDMLGEHVDFLQLDSAITHLTALAVPFTVRGQAGGVLLLVRFNVDKPYMPADLSLASDFISRAAASLENTLLLQRIQEADQRKNEFLATLAHELRNPLAPIRNALSVMKKSSDAEIRRQAEDTIERQLKHMVHLVDDLMDVSRITQGKIELRREPILLLDAINHATESVLPLIHQCGHTLDVHMPEQEIWLNADLSRISQIFSNLLNNAAKYTDIGGKIELFVSLQDQSVSICVRDNGIGIPSEMLTRIFGMFEQVDSSLERAQGGLGIGLTLVKSLIEMHGGTIAVSSNGVGMGSEFIVTLPVIEVSGKNINANAEDTEQLASHKSLKVLIVDDNEASAQTLGWMVEIFGHEVALAHSGTNAIAHAQEYNPDIVLLDIGLPGMSGYEVCHALCQLPSLKNTVFIAQTGWGQKEHRERSKQAGFHYHLVKPIEMSTLESLIKEITVSKNNV